MELITVMVVLHAKIQTEALNVLAILASLVMVQ